MRLIDAEALMQKLSRMIDYCKKDTKVNAITALFQVGDAIMDVPTIEAKPVVHAHWIPKEIYSKYFTDQFECSNCHYISVNYLIIPKDEFEADYCPICGAQMDEKESD